MSHLEILIAQAVRDWQAKHAVVCEHSQIIDYGRLAEELAPMVREQIASEIETELEADGDGSSWDGGMSNAARIARGATR